MRRVLAIAAAVLAATAAGLSGCAYLVFRDMAALPSEALAYEASPSAPHAADRAQASRPFSASFVAGHAGTEITDLLGPWAVLEASGLFANRLVAASLSPRPLTGGLFALPDDRLRDARPADLIVIPAVVDPAEPALLAWLRANAPHGRSVLSVCAGAELAAAAGLLEGRRTTTHAFSLASLQERYPGAHFLPGHRYVEDGPIVSSAGVTAGIDAALLVVERFSSRAHAERTAGRLGIAWLREADPGGERARPGYEGVGAGDLGPIVWNLARRPWRRDVAVGLRNGTSELALAVALDAFPRTLRARVHPFPLSPTDRGGDAPGRPVTLAHGLRVLAPAPPPPDRIETWVHLPGNVEGRVHLPAAAPENAERFDLRDAAPGEVLERTLAYIAAEHGARTARYVARMIEAPEALVARVSGR